MPLARLADVLHEASFTEPQYLVYNPGRLVVQVCESWIDPSSRCEVALVYRSPQIKVTSKRYIPVAQYICGADGVDTLLDIEIEDEGMLLGRANALVLRLARTNLNTGPCSLDKVRKTLEASAKGMLANG